MRIPAPKSAAERPPLQPAAKASALIFLAGVELVSVSRPRIAISSPSRPRGC